MQVEKKSISKAGFQVGRGDGSINNNYVGGIREIEAPSIKGIKESRSSTITGVTSNSIDAVKQADVTVSAIGPPIHLEDNANKSTTSLGHKAKLQRNSPTTRSSSSSRKDVSNPSRDFVKGDPADVSKLVRRPTESFDVNSGADRKSIASKSDKRVGKILNVFGLGLGKKTSKWEPNNSIRSQGKDAVGYGGREIQTMARVGGARASVVENRNDGGKNSGDISGKGQFAGRGGSVEGKRGPEMATIGTSVSSKEREREREKDTHVRTGGAQQSNVTTKDSKKGDGEIAHIVNNNSCTSVKSTGNSVSSASERKPASRVGKDTKAQLPNEALSAGVRRLMDHRQRANIGSGSVKVAGGGEKDIRYGYGNSSGREKRIVEGKTQGTVVKDEAKTSVEGKARTVFPKIEQIEEMKNKNRTNQATFQQAGVAVQKKVNVLAQRSLTSERGGLGANPIEESQKRRIASIEKKGEQSDIENNKNVNQMIEKLEKRYKAEIAKLEKLNVQNMANSKAEVEKLLSELKNRDETIGKLTEEAEVMWEQVLESRAENEALIAELATKEKEIEDKQVATESLSAALKEAVERRAELEEDIEKLRHPLEMKMYEKTINTLIVERDQLKAKMSSLLDETKHKDVVQKDDDSGNDEEMHKNRKSYENQDNSHHEILEEMVHFVNQTLSVVGKVLGCKFTVRINPEQEGEKTRRGVVQSNTKAVKSQILVNITETTKGPNKRRVGERSDFGLKPKPMLGSGGKEQDGEDDENEGCSTVNDQTEQCSLSQPQPQPQSPSSSHSPTLEHIQDCKKSGNDNNVLLQPHPQSQDILLQHSSLDSDETCFYNLEQLLEFLSLRMARALQEVEQKNVGGAEYGMAKETEKKQSGGTTSNIQQLGTIGAMLNSRTSAGNDSDEGNESPPEMPEEHKAMIQQIRDYSTPVKQLFSLLRGAGHDPLYLLDEKLARLEYERAKSQRELSRIPHKQRRYKENGREQELQETILEIGGLISGIKTRIRAKSNN